MPDTSARMIDTAAATPMMAQYLEIKAAHPDCLLSSIAWAISTSCSSTTRSRPSPALDIALTKRGQHDGDDIPMCGVPVHSHEAYLARLIRQGFKVAVCEQIEDPAEAKKRGGKAAGRARRGPASSPPAR